MSQLKNTQKKLRVAIIGTGKIGLDLLWKCINSPWLECRLFAGRNEHSKGITTAIGLGIPVSTKGIQAIIESGNEIDLVFDATSAQAHYRNAEILASLNIIAVDLTPAKVGVMCVPAINLDECISNGNINMVSCGGQASIPIAYALAKSGAFIDYIETVSTIASKSAGPATRYNLDEYIDTTETGLKHFIHADKAKAILNINPAEYGVCMQTTVFASIRNMDMDRICAEVDAMVKKVQCYVPGYELILEPLLDNQRLAMIVRTTAESKTLPRYAGNLDIIDCAAIAVAEAIAKKI